MQTVGHSKPRDVERHENTASTVYKRPRGHIVDCAAVRALRIREYREYKRYDLRDTIADNAVLTLRTVIREIVTAKRGLAKLTKRLGPFDAE